MAEDRDELLAQLGALPFRRERRLARAQAVLRGEVEADQAGEQLERPDCLGRVEASRPRVQAAQRPEELTVRTRDRHRDVALEPVHLRRRVAAEDLVVGDAVDDHGLAGVANLVADRGFDTKLAARLEAEGDFIAHRAPRTAQTIQRSSITRATAAKPRPVVRHPPRGSSALRRSWLRPPDRQQNCSSRWFLGDKQWVVSTRFKDSPLGECGYDNAIFYAISYSGQAA